MARQLISLLLHLLLLVIVASPEVPPSSTSPQDDIVKPGCPSACGDVRIPYPFGIGADCFLNESFSITCNNSIPYLGDSNFDLVNISLTDGLLVVNNYIAYDCYDRDGLSESSSEPWIDIRGLPNYKFSSVRNKFIAVGCDTYAYISLDEEGSTLWTGCSSFCNRRSDVHDDGTCSGIGCCSVPIPKVLRAFWISLYSEKNHTQCWDFNPCSFAFVTNEDHFKFNRSSLTELRNVTNIPVTLDWAIMGENCEKAQGRNKSAYACASPNSYCVDSTNGPGYLCKCSEGFDGNPYLQDGCKVLNMREDDASYEGIYYSIQFIGGQLMYKMVQPLKLSFSTCPAAAQTFREFSVFRLNFFLPTGCHSTKEYYMVRWSMQSLKKLDEPSTLLSCH